MELQYVVLPLQQPTDGWLAVQGRVRPVAIVVMEPILQRRVAMRRGLVGCRIGPFAQRTLDEAFGLAVRLGCIGLGPEMFDIELCARLAPGA